MPGYFGRLSVGVIVFEDEDYCPSFNILVGRGELLQPPELIVWSKLIWCADGTGSDDNLKSSRFKRGQVQVNCQFIGRASATLSDLIQSLQFDAAWWPLRASPCITAKPIPPMTPSTKFEPKHSKKEKHQNTATQKDQQ